MFLCFYPQGDRGPIGPAGASGAAGPPVSIIRTTYMQNL